MCVCPVDPVAYTCTCAGNALYINQYLQLVYICVLNAADITLLSQKVAVKMCLMC